VSKFDRQAVVQYATQWALSRNPAFSDFSSNAGGGGDCSNFISQCMLAGGWWMVEDVWSRTVKQNVSSDDWSINYSTTKSWASAFWLFYYLMFQSGRVSLTTVSNMDLGDIVMMQLPNQSAPNHAMVVTKRSQTGGVNNIYLSYHSTDTLNKALTDIQNNYSNKCVYYYFKVNDTFDDPPVKYTPSYYD